MSRLELFVSGYLGKDAELKITENGRKVVNFSLAHSERFKVGDTWNEKTVWVSCAIWIREGKEDNITQYLKKGTLINAWGYPQSECWINKENAPQSQIRLKIDKWDLLSKPKEGATEQAVAQPEGPQASTPIFPSNPNSQTDDDLPF